MGTVALSTRYPQIIYSTLVNIEFAPIIETSRSGNPLQRARHS